MNNPIDQDSKYLNLVISKIKVSSAYKPKFGQKDPVSLEYFNQLYGTDPFYSWLGLDNPSVYAAHKAAGGITSLYRQIGIGCEKLFRQLICDKYDVTEEQAKWSYRLKVPDRKKDRVLSLDGRIEINYIQSEEEKLVFKNWLQQASQHAQLNPNIANALSGCVFEVRQGYKSKDSKRQNGDISNAVTAIAQGYLPIATILSNQIDTSIAARYAERGWLVMRGTLDLSPVTSTYAFCTQVLGYDLAGFFERHSAELKTAVNDVVQNLLQPDAAPLISETELAEELLDDEDNNDFEA